MTELSAIINNSLAKTQNIIKFLEKISIENEPIFLKLGKNLQALFTDAKNLTALTRETALLLDGSSNDNILGNIGMLTKASLTRLQTCQEDVVHVLPKVEKYTTNLKRLHNICSIVKNIAKKLHIVARHIAIESSRSKECEEMFSFFVNEIRQLAERVKAISIRIWEDSENANSRQIADLSSFEVKKDRLNALADSAHHSVEDNVQEIENLINISFNAIQGAEKHSKNLYTLVGEIVVAIQFHDITRQQIEHIVQSLREILPILNTGRYSESALSENQENTLAKAYSIWALQAEQINQVIKEINSSYNKIRQSFIEIDNEIQNLVNEMIDLCENKGNSGVNINPFQQLTSGLYQLDKIMTQAKEMAEMIDYNLKQSAETAQSMAGQLTQMNDISTDLHIKAINALIMSKRLGSHGKTLSILAEDVTEVSLESNEFVLDVVEILKAIEELSTNSSNITVMDEVNIKNNTSGIPHLSANDVISAVYADYLAKTKLSIERSKDLKNKIVLLEADIEFLNKIESSLICQKEEIYKMMESISPFMTEKSLANDELEHLGNRYTMEIERGVHNKTLGKDTLPKNENFSSDNKISNSVKEDKDGYIADNVELF